MANLKLIEAKTVGVGGTSSVTFTSIPQTYTDLKLVYSVRSTSSTSNVIDISFNGNTSNFTNKYLLGTGTSPSSGSNFSRFSGLQNSSVDTANTFANGEIYIPNYTGSNNKSYSGDAGQEINSSTGNNLMLLAGLWSNTAAITTITINGYDGNFVQNSTFYLYGISNVTTGSKATGGIISYDSSYYYHMFPYSGTFTPTESISADVLVIAGGGSGGSDSGGGGGAGGLLGFTSQSLTTTSYTVTVGAGGTAAVSAGAGNNGSNSQFASLTASVGGGGGGGGGADPKPANTGKNGGSGGGGGGRRLSYSPASGGTGTAGQGNNGGTANGGDGNANAQGGGGGAGGVGGNATPSTGPDSQDGRGGNGGVGLSTYSSWAYATQTGVSGYYAGGGGGEGGVIQGSGGLGGGGNSYFAGIANTGGGGGSGAKGGSGLVIIRYAI